MNKFIEFHDSLIERDNNRPYYKSTWEPCQLERHRLIPFQYKKAGTDYFSIYHIKDGVETDITDYFYKLGNLITGWNYGGGGTVTTSGSDISEMDVPDGDYVYSDNIALKTNDNIIFKFDADFTGSSDWTYHVYLSGASVFSVTGKKIEFTYKALLDGDYTIRIYKPDGSNTFVNGTSESYISLIFIHNSYVSYHGTALYHTIESGICYFKINDNTGLYSNDCDIGCANSLGGSNLFDTTEDYDPVIYNTLHQSSGEDYYHFGILTHKKNTNIVTGLYHLGDSHTSTTGEIYLRKSNDFGRTFESEIMIANDVSYKCLNVGGGYDSNGRLHVFYLRMTNTGVFISMNYMYSDDDGDNFSTPVAMDTSPVLSTVCSPYDNLEELPDGTLLQSAWTRNTATTLWELVLYKSTDSGATWTAISVADGDWTSSGRRYSELTIEHLTGNYILGISRRVSLTGSETGMTYHQWLSKDLGETWIEIGDVTFDSWTSPGAARERQVHLNHIDYFGKKIIELYYVHTTDRKLKVIYGLPIDLIEGVTGWNANTLTEILDTYTYGGTYTRDGHTSVVHHPNSYKGIGQMFYEVTGVNDISDVVMFHTPLWNMETVFSELNIDMSAVDHVILNISSNVDYADIYYKGGFKQWIFKKANVRRSAIPNIEVIGEQRNGEIYVEKTISSTKYKIVMKCTEAELNAFITSIGATKTAVDQSGKKFTIYNMSIEQPVWYNSNGIVTITFDDNINVFTQNKSDL